MPRIASGANAAKKPYMRPCPRRKHHHAYALRTLFPKSDLLTLLRRRARLNLFSSSGLRASPWMLPPALDFFTSHPMTTASSPKTGLAFRSQRAHAILRIHQTGSSPPTWRRPERRTRLAFPSSHPPRTAALLHSSEVHEKISRDFRQACISVASL